MDLDYDRKFDEMKKYVPFLESMIKKLEITSTGSSNPRQAQLDKIRSLRDLLLDKKKRMKMDNLLKCEQVLVNLYAKVEQKDLSSSKETAEKLKSKEIAELEVVRNKLKAVAKRKEDDSLPEIAGANEIPETSMAGSKEPALFQRRPNKNSLSPRRHISPAKYCSHEMSSKRNYTRILVSPESSPQRWSSNESRKSDRPLFSRRSPRKSPKRHSPTYKRERKKSKSSRKQEDLNITLKVPEESLNSLNTTNIISRIITCSDGDVDIETLRMLREQILNELKNTGATEDISELILQSNSKKKKPKEKVEVEEGELSDSESEAIESIYGSLVILDKEQKTSGHKTNKEDIKPRKIQIRLVINSDKDLKSNNDLVPPGKTVEPNEFDKFDFEMYQADKPDESKSNTNDSVNKDISLVEISESKCASSQITINDTEINDAKNLEKNPANDSNNSDESKVSEGFELKNLTNTSETTEKTIFKPNFYKPLTDQDPSADSIETNKSNQDKVDKTLTPDSEKKGNIPEVVTSNVTDKVSNTMNKDVEIPLLNERSVASHQPKESVVSEIDILQALKNEILSESIAIPGTDAATPPLHQPKITKVASAQEIAPKKRISIENYKKKSSSSVTTVFHSKETSSTSNKDEQTKKQSLKLTDKEFQRFKSILNDIVSSDDDDNTNDSIASVEDVYADLAPKSPDDDHSIHIESNTPIIIPIDPVKSVEVNAKADIDMRKMNPLPSPQYDLKQSANDILTSKDATKFDKNNSEKTRTLLVDPRMKKVFDNTSKENLNQYAQNPDRTPQQPTVNFPIMAPTIIPNIIPNITPIMTPNITPSMTPSRTPSMTPRPFEMSHQSFEIEDQPKRKHVYTSLYDTRDNRDQSVTRDTKSSHWEKQENTTENRSSRWDASEMKDSRKWDDHSRSESVQRESQDFQKYTRHNDSYNYKQYKNSRNDRYSFDKRDERHNRLDQSTPSHTFGRSECPPTPTHTFGRSDCPLTPNHPFGRSECPPTPSHPFGRSECPPTPSHPFGRSECPPTPSHPFGRSECPPTPGHSFGRSEYPLTPNHPFGRSECPPTPSHVFGRSECPPTPSHTFGRSEIVGSDLPMTPSHPFGRLDRDPRLKRNSDYESKSQSEDKEHGYYRNRNKQYGSYNNSYKKTDNYRNYRDKGDGRNGRNRYYSQDQNERHYYKDSNSRELYSRNGRSVGTDYYDKDENIEIRQSRHREQSDGRSIPLERTFVRSSSRARSVARSFEIDNDNTLSIKSHAGRSFTIDTSVNRTFQDFLNKNNHDKVIDFTFDVRRQRAASVGRSCSSNRDTSVGRTLPRSFQSFNSSTHENVNRNFRRARSVVRYTEEPKMNRSFSEIKADFESYKLKAHENESESIGHDNVQSKRAGTRNVIAKTNYDAYSTKSTKSYSKLSYSPRKNNRDPRLHRESHFDQSNYKNDKNKVFRERNKHGIIYSNDNIASGSILGSGYGVKNYKIPKIKRVLEIEPTKELSEKSKNTEIKQPEKKLEDKIKENVISQNKNDLECKKISIERKSKKTEQTTVDVSKSNTQIETTEKRITRSNTKESELLSRSQHVTKFKRRIRVYDSDSDDNSKHSDTNCNKHSNIENEMQERNKTNEQDLDSSFGVDDLEMFSDNIGDPVLDNINALIADLDDDLNAPKSNSNNNFSNDISLENMLENITSPVIESPNKQNADDIALSDITEIIKNDAHENNEILNDDLNLSTSTNNATSDILQESQISPSKKNHNKDSTKTLALENAGVQSTSQKEPLFTVKDGNEDYVSTTEIDSKVHKKVEDAIVDQDNNKSSGPCSIPDSTNNVISSNKPIMEDGLPDSTNEIQSEMNITSTHDSSETVKCSVQQTSSNKSLAPVVDSIGSILSILQNKSKIKELLSMLDDQTTDNEKIKKKLEKLSEIVSDDEDTKDGTDETGTNKILNIEPSKACDDNDATSSKETIDTYKNTISENIDIEVHAENPVTPETFENNETICDNKEICENKEGMSKNNEKTDQNKVDALNNEEEISENNVGTNENNEENILAESVEFVENKETKENPVDKVTIKRGKIMKRTKSGKYVRKTVSNVKRVTRSESASLQKPKKKVSRELLKLQEDIREMFISDDILNATGIRMCRLAKLVDEKTAIHKDNVSGVTDTEPVVVLEKFKNAPLNLETPLPDSKTRKIIKKKPGPKSKVLKGSSINIETKIEKIKHKYKPGPKSKTKVAKNPDVDPYEFETDSITESSISKVSEGSLKESSDSESESLASSKSFESAETLFDVKKKPKRKRPAWNAGVIKPKNRKRKADCTKNVGVVQKTETSPRREEVTIPDMNCFTDKTYCFLKNVSTYSCRLCVYSGNDIVAHYKKQHPHSEIPLSRLNPETAKEAIEQCEDINFQAISKIPMNKFVCRFCHSKEFGKKKNALESFFWHVVSTHTGEYKQLCSNCINITRCPFNLDIPPPPKDTKGQLIGYICGKCNFTQISLENLKTHVIVRHNDEQTEVYTINLAVMSKKLINIFSRQNSVSETDQPRKLRSTRYNQSMTETSDDRSDVTDTNESSFEMATDTTQTVKDKKKTVEVLHKSSFQSKITFENDDSEISNITNADDISKVTIKQEKDDDEVRQEGRLLDEKSHTESGLNSKNVETRTESKNTTSSDIFAYPHFKIAYTETGNKEFVCCINGNDRHYKTSLLISMKKHVQIKHKEKWDGYCFICKVIVTPQGQHLFKDCLQHFLDKHIDDFPVLEKVASEPEKPIEASAPAPKAYINVRPLSELKEIGNKSAEVGSAVLPKIESVVSLSNTESSSNYPVGSVTEKRTGTVPRPEDEQYKFEEAQVEVMSKKYHIVLEAMMTKEKLVNVYKCPGRFCSFTTDSADVALMHALTHQQIGGENALRCAYCDFDCGGHPIDLVVHVFKHGASPFVCGYCFYRAVVSQLVIAHINRAHAGKPLRVLHATNAAAPPSQNDAVMLSREVVVPYYICRHEEKDGRCKFRTYTARKFTDHLLQRHSDATYHCCHECSAQFSTPPELVHHMKEHNYNLYQCTWCLHGADGESELLSHAAAAHPTRLPQAYLRIITTKEGSSEYRVLPLASFNKSKVATIEVTPNPTNENPVREAERSIELEKLIGFTTQLTMSMETAESEVDKNREDNSQFSTDLPQNMAVLEPILAGLNRNDPLPPHTTPPHPSTSQPQADLSHQDTSVLKTEPDSATPSKESSDDVVCLDSDDDLSRQTVIDLSEEDANRSDASKAADGYKKIPETLLFKCPKCKLVFKGGPGLKIHLTSCYGGIVLNIPCAHCSKMNENKEQLAAHYVRDHGVKSSYLCGICGAPNVSLAMVKKHVKAEHKVTKMVVSAKYAEDGTFEHTVTASSKPAKAMRAPKRKLSSSSGSESQPKLKRYGPQDIDLLPINPILDDLVHCSVCSFSTKVRLNMVRHLQFHAEQQPVPQMAPVNPVPHLETNEMHFDKMVNLASSSIVNRVEKATRSESAPVVSTFIPPEVASRYPKYVPERQRHTCGAKGCSYISVDEAMLKCHWETLHSGSNNFHCVHCPPYQHLDTSKPLTASRILAHLKMHDTTLYACSSCSYYHYKRQVVEKHLSEIHKGSQLMVVREETTSAPSTQPTQPVVTAPTMDLKPWQCGLCKFKSMLRPEVIEHCAKLHQSKMQFKCAYCPFRTSTLENVTKHQSNAHSGKVEDIFYYYYREGSIPDEPDGKPRWLIQRQKAGLTAEAEVKTEVPDPSLPKEPMSSVQSPPPLTVDLNIVKKEVDAIPATELSMEDLCKKYGNFCDTNGLKYKCPLCKVVTEDDKESMQSHLYEELQYRKWACVVCTYKAFHKAGLYDHMSSEHPGQYQSPKELQVDVNIENWVTGLLEHQTKLIQSNKENLAKQRIQIPPPVPSTSIVHKPAVIPSSSSKANMKELEQAFGPFGGPSNSLFSCPKCAFKVKDEVAMYAHLESELTKIRWCCSKCSDNFQTYHEVQFHCKSVHDGQFARPIEAIRDPAIRTSWVTTVIQVQKLGMKNTHMESIESSSEKSDVDNSLLVVRYEENIHIPEEVVRRKRPAPGPSGDSDDERLVIDLPSDNSPVAKKFHGKCPYCEFETNTRSEQVVRCHILRHYNLKPYKCPICDYNNHRPAVVSHIEVKHSNTSVHPTPVAIPTGPPLILNLQEQKFRKTADAEDDGQKSVCLLCEKLFTETETLSHMHDNVSPDFAKKGDVVVKCCLCLSLWKDVPKLQEHHNSVHSNVQINYAYFRLLHDTRNVQCCGHCNKHFKSIRDLKRHHEAVHRSLTLKSKVIPFVPSSVVNFDDAEAAKASDMGPSIKRVAKKSTTKLPVQRVAKKSTTKLPLHFNPDLEEYSYYGQKRAPLEDFPNVTTLMPFYNRIMSFPIKKLSEIIDIDPKVVVKDFKSGTQ